MTANWLTEADVIVIPVAPYDPYRLLPAAVGARGARKVGLLGVMVCFGAASVAFSVTLATLLAIHF